MSIISEALKKAEQERIAKGKSSFTGERAGYGTGSLTDQLAAIEVDVTKRILASQIQYGDLKPKHFFFLWEFWKAFLFLGVIVLLCLTLFLLPRWPSLAEKNSSDIWQSSTETVSSQAISANVSPEIPAATSDKMPVQENSSSPEAGKSEENTPPVPVNPYVLTGLSVSGKDHYAIVNRLVVKVGDLIGQAHVKSIENGQVVLDTDTGEVTLQMAA